MVTPMRMGGLVSGLDTTQIIKDLMKAEKAPLNKLVQKKQTEEWRRDQYREINALLLDFQKSTFDMKLQSTYLKKTVSSDNEAVVSAKQKGTPTLSTYDIDVTNAYTPAKPASVKFVTAMADNTTAIGEAFDFTVGASTISVAATDTIGSVVAKINAATTSTGVTASFLKDDNSITFTTTTAGANAAISIGGNFGLNNKLNLSVGTVNSSSDNFATAAGAQWSKSATAGTVKINGIQSTINSSTFIFDGIEFATKATGITKVNVKPDEDAVFNSIKGFVDKYNDLISKMNGKLTEQVYRDYKPLLDEEKQALSEQQIQQWEDKAKSGLLRQDTLLSGTLFDMRRALSTPVTGTGVDPNFDSFNEVGITTGLYQENGKLYLDETKLRQAISQNGSKVMDLFTKVSSSTDAQIKYNESGLATRLYDGLKDGIRKLTDKAGSAGYLVDKSAISKDLKGIDSDISNWQSRLKDIEDRYWRRFTAMETAMSKANSQGDWLAQQFAAK